MISSSITAREFESLPSAPGFRNNPFGQLAWLGRGLIGTLFGLAMLAGMASVPGLNLLAMGFLLEITGRVAQTGRIRSAFYLIPLSARLAGIVIPAAIVLLPVQFLVGLARDAALISPGSAISRGWIAAAALSGIIAAGHLLMVIARGGNCRWFFRPLNNFRWLRSRLREGNYWDEADRILRELGESLRPGHHFRLGCLAYLGAYAWLALPSLLFGLTTELSGRAQTLSILVGGSALVIVLGWQPLLQAHFAESGRWRALFELGTVRKRFRHTPFCLTLSVALLFGLSILVLLYEALYKNKMPFHSARWDVMIVFLVTVLPAKILVALAWHRSGNRPEAWRIWQWFNRLLLAFGLGWYVYFLFIAWTGGQLGREAMWQYHSVLLPSPF